MSVPLFDSLESTRNDFDARARDATPYYAVVAFASEVIVEMESFESGMCAAYVCGCMNAWCCKSVYVYVWMRVPSTPQLGQT